MQKVSTPAAAGPLPLLLCLSHLRWDWVYQRPQHLMTRAAASFRVVFLEEPITPADTSEAPLLRTRVTPEGITVATPVLPAGLGPIQADVAQRTLLDGLLTAWGEQPSVVWY